MGVIILIFQVMKILLPDISGMCLTYIHNLKKRNLNGS